jgi:hypothetical protein
MEADARLDRLDHELDRIGNQLPLRRLVRRRLPSAEQGSRYALEK